jgi:CheY-like chemotaxis protein
VAKILLVDDDQTWSSTVSDWLRYEGYRVEVCSSGNDGWQLMKSQQFDVVLISQTLSDLAAIDMLKRYRAMTVTTPVIIFSEEASLDDCSLAFEAGADDFLKKPCHFKELSARLKAILRRYGVNSNKQAQVTWRHTIAGDAQTLECLQATELGSRYEFLQILGKGGMGIVYKARHFKLDKYFAIKILRRSEMSLEACARFAQEARLISALAHVNIAAVHDLGFTEHGCPFMVLDYIEGSDLATLVDRSKGLPPEDTLEIIKQIAQGMQCAHDAGIVHRDLKPSNIMISSRGDKKIAKVLDFGCAKVRNGKSDPTLTQEGLTVGTPHYMSPEQAAAGNVDHRTDIYALGCILYETLTGAVPHEGKTSIEVMMKHMQQAPAPMNLRRTDRDFPADLEAIVNKSLAKDPKARFQRMDEFATAIERFQSGSGFWHSLQNKLSAPLRLLNQQAIPYANN